MYLQRHGPQLGTNLFSETPAAGQSPIPMMLFISIGADQAATARAIG